MTKIKYFGEVAEIIGKWEEDIPIQSVTVFEYKKEIRRLHPKLIVNFQIAIDQDLADDDAIINLENEIAILPPYSGG